MTEPSSAAHAVYDLHLHTHFSYDATATVEEVFRSAHAQGIRYLAITEHHVLDSRGEVQAVARRYPEVTCVPAAEVTVTTSIGSVDLLCYGFPPEDTPALRAVLDEYHEWQRAYGAAVCAGMQAIGFDYTDAHRREVLRSYRPQSALAVQGWTHVQNGRQRDYFIERGFIATAEEYDRVLSEARKARPSPRYPAAERVVSAVKECGALVVIAHPNGYFASGDRARMDLLRRECRLDGVECAHPSVPVEMRPVYRAYCLEYALISTGGSDCHSAEHLAANLGRHGGPDAWWPEIEARLNAARARGRRSP